MATLRTGIIGRSLRRALPAIVAASSLLAMGWPLGAAASPPPQPIANTPFERVWQRADLPVSMGIAKRSWLWGPKANATTMEPLAQSPGGKRQVQYYDKSRMEINDPRADQNSPWYVTNGLLVVEMLSGRMQIGFDTFEQRSPATVQVAGDPPMTMGAARITPTYADVARVASLSPGHNEVQPRAGQEVRETLTADGTVHQGAPNIGMNLPKYQYYEPTTHHNVPDVFMSFMNQRGTVYENGKYVDGQVFNWVYAMGYPLTEPYWITIEIAGKKYPVMMQAFQRRLLTYNPANAPEWRVEMGNVGMQYYQWRYNSLPTPPPNPVPKVGTVMAMRRMDGLGVDDPRSFSNIHTELYTLVTAQADWDLLWQRYIGPNDKPPKTPPVAFGREIVAAAFWGDRPDSCYRLTIQEVRVKDNVITVYLDQTIKQGTCLTVITQPHDMVVVSTQGITPGKYKAVFVANGTTELTSKDVLIP